MVTDSNLLDCLGEVNADMRNCRSICQYGLTADFRCIVAQWPLWRNGQTLQTSLSAHSRRSTLSTRSGFLTKYVG